MSDHTHGEYEISENQKRYYTPTTEEMDEVFTHCLAYPPSAKIRLCDPNICDCMTDPWRNQELIKGEPSE